MIKAEHEDKIFLFKTFLDKLNNVINKEYDQFAEELMADGLHPTMEEYLFDYLYNNQDTNESFSEYVEKFGFGE